MPCDTASPLPQLQSFLKSIFPNVNHDIDFSKLLPPYPSKTGPYAFTKSAILSRGQSCLSSLAQRTEGVVAVVSHHGFLRTAIANLRFENADYRVFGLVDCGEECVGGKEWALDEQGRLRGRWVLSEREETERAGGGMGKSDRERVGIREGDFPDEDADVEGEGRVGEQQ